MSDTDSPREPPVLEIMPDPNTDGLTFFEVEPPRTDENGEEIDSAWIKVGEHGYVDLDDIAGREVRR